MVAPQLTNESLVRVSGSLTTSTETACEVSTLCVSELTVLSQAKAGSSISNSFRSLHGGPKGEDDEQKPNQLGCHQIDQRLDERVLDVRVASTAAIFKVFSGVNELAVEFLAMRDFYRIATPSLISYEYPGEEDDHFAVPYFDKTAWLAPTGEVHLGMALAADLERVYDIHNVFRQERDVDGRHLTEFTMLELVFALDQGWEEILNLAIDLLIFLIQSLQERTKYAQLAPAVQRLHPSSGPFKLGLVQGKLLRITFREAKTILRTSLDMQSSFEDDFTPEEEAALGRFLSSDESHLGPPTDIFAVTHFPKHLRSCNVYPSEDGSSTNSFDIIMRGQEVSTGYQLLNSHEQLRTAFATRAHPIDPDSPGWRPFVAAHEFGMPPWGGFGMGLNRFVQVFLGLNDIREATLFPRNSARLTP
ncbi:aspartate-tRNA ligase [Colletotrichum truncatum]|uniref:Aspartate-tRNA ligase n=1 Tax=Colletotrichum truncatum TaxID=5467 RepID=A0ACC3YD78_COLTU|nr:aspartate-tRNA ligase [Colletotrichum truncatum]KAF6784825.1 aspartate-tRNA ligase [Colletotrichum truncatum]